MPPARSKTLLQPAACLRYLAEVLHNAGPPGETATPKPGEVARCRDLYTANTGSLNLIIERSCDHRELRGRRDQAACGPAAVNLG
jgi:hypothetical protein